MTGRLRSGHIQLVSIVLGNVCTGTHVIPDPHVVERAGETLGGNEATAYGVLLLSEGEYTAPISLRLRRGRTGFDQGTVDVKAQAAGWRVP